MGSSPPIHTQRDQLTSVVGSLEHKRDVYLSFARVDQPVVNKFLTTAAQSVWLKEHFPSLVPDDDSSGTEPSDFKVAAAFQLNYHVSLRFRQVYLHWLYSQDV